MPTLSGSDAASRAWRREQMDLSSDIEGLHRDPHAEAMVAALDAVELTDGERVAAITEYFTALARGQARATA